MALRGAQEYTTEVAAPPRVCFETITDFERYPEWFSAIDHARVLARDRSGRGREVEFHVDLRLKRIRYVLAYEYEEPYRLAWTSVDGDIESIEGTYLFQPVDRTTTRATCRQAVAIGFWVPGPIRKIMEGTALRQSVLEFQAAAEAAARSAAPAPRRRGQGPVR